MAKYHPIQIGVPLAASRSDLIDFQWTSGGISAVFIMPDYQTQMLRVAFDRQCIVRLLDEMPLSTEDEIEPNEGLISEHFAYRVQNSAFCRAQSEAWKMCFQSISHYRFITGWTCLDVLSQATPSFTVIPRASARLVT